MTVKECVLKAVKYLGLNRLIKNGDIDTEQNAAEAEAFLEMAKNIIDEICADYYPLKVIETLTVGKDGVILLKNLNRAPIDIFALKKNGATQAFTLKYDRIIVPFTGSCEIEYSFKPSIGFLSDEVPFPAKISSRIIACGIASEYCIINGLDEAVTWDKKYRDAISKAVMQKSERRVKRRLWA